MNGKPGEFSGVLDATRKVLKHDKLGLFKGFWPRYLRVGPFTILSFVFYEKLRNLSSYLLEQLEFCASALAFLNYIFHFTLCIIQERFIFDIKFLDNYNYCVSRIDLLFGSLLLLLLLSSLKYRFCSCCSKQFFFNLQRCFFLSFSLTSIYSRLTLVIRLEKRETRV